MIFLCVIMYENVGLRLLLLGRWLEMSYLRGCWVGVEKGRGKILLVW